MDKVKVALALLKKYHFWVMTLGVLLVGFIGWFLAKKKLWDEYKANKSQIEQRFEAMKRIRSDPEAKNEDWIKGVEIETTALKDKVALAWKKVYIEQRDHVLKWPETLAYRKSFEEAGLTGEIAPQALEEYRNYIREEFPHLLAIVDAQDYGHAKESVGRKPAAKGAAEAPAGEEFIVIWDAKNQEQVDKQLIWDRIPTSDEVRETQENLWVYEALLKIIGGPKIPGSVNEFASGNYNAKVKRIEELLIGKDAASVFQDGMAEGRKEIETPQGATAATEGTPSAGPTEKVVEGRYVDEKGTALPPTPPGTPAPTTEFKRMPVVMKLIMDERELTRLLVACANSPLPVEVRQFRVHTIHTAKQVARGGSSGSATGPDKNEWGPHDVSVDLRGIIYIFNPPDPTKLGPAAALNEVADATADAKGAPAAGAAVPSTPEPTQ